MTKRNVFLSGETIDLVVLEATDAGVTMRYMNDHGVTEFLSRGDTLTTLESQTEWIEGTHNRTDDLTLGIWHRADQKLIGTTGLHSINQRDQNADFGIVIGNRDYWSKGCGSEALQLLLDFAFTIKNLRQVKLEVFAHNPRAVRCYEKCGFKMIGTIPNRIYKAGAWRDVHIMLVERPE